MSPDCYVMEYIKLSDTFSSEIVKGNGVLVVLAVGTNRY